MRLQTTETVPTADTERVLHALEAALREFSDELERKGPRITLYGLGPSPRARNYRDTAIFDVTTENGSTTIRADVVFQASALLGPSAQEEIVASKLDYAFDQMRMQLGLPESGRVTPQTRAAYVEPQPAPEAEQDFEDSLPATAPAAEEESSMWPPLAPAAAEEDRDHAEDASGEPNLAFSEGGSDEPKPEPSEPVRSATPFSEWAASLRSVRVPPAAGPGSVVEGSEAVEEPEPEAPALALGAETHRTNLPIVLAILLGVAVAAGSVYLYWSGVLARVNLGFAHSKAAAPAPQPAPAPPPVEAPVTAPVAAIPAPPAPPRHEEADPKVWLEQWADAMRGRDADLLASFYADPVVRYQDDANVSREALTTSFRSQMQAQSGLWTMKLEHVSIEPVTTNHVIARVSKHFMELENSSTAADANQTGAAANQITDRYVRSRLELRRTDGEWKIVSEQDVTPAGGIR